MIWLVIFTLVLVVGISEAIVDTLAFRYNDSIFKSLNPNFWNPDVSYKNKYKEGSKLKKWAFKTVLVFTTDAWHLFKTIRTMALFFIIVLLFYYMVESLKTTLGFSSSLLFLYLCTKVVFELFHSKIFKK